MNENEEIAYENGRDEGYNDGYSDGYKALGEERQQFVVK